ncbi:MAG: hypothetical protein JXB88_14400 [Spirochaetales bacterium]|nr:hypothetical protein [Spirochaetales bacterium]
MRKLLFIPMSFFITLNAFSQGALSFNLGGAYSIEEPEVFKPDMGFLAGLDIFHSFTNTISLFSSLGGFINYRYLDAEWHYLYNYSLDISFRGNTYLLKPSLKFKGEQFFSHDFSAPHVWENSGELYFSYDIGTSSLFISPGLSWEDDGIFLKGKCGYIFPFLTYYIMTLEFSAGKTVIYSENNELYFSPEVQFSWYPPKPFTLTSTFIFTWYDSDYESELEGVVDPLPLYDFIKFYMDIEYSTFIGEKITCTFYIPLVLTLKRHNAVENDTILEQKEWIFSTGLQVDVGIDFLKNNRCVISISGEKAFSNSTYQDTGECILSVAYEFLF